MLGRIAEWARSDPNVVALVLTGSHARVTNSPPPDAFSDLDVEVIADDVSTFVRDDDWWRRLGDVWVYWFDESPGEPSRLIVYEPGQKVDFSLHGRQRIVGQRERLDQLYERGYRVLLDKEQLTAELPPPSGQSPQRRLPTQAEFTAVVNEFWFEAFHIPGYILRGDLWVVKFRDWTMKEMLLKVLEWRALAAGPADVWHIGHRMRDWVDDAIWEEVHAIFGSFDAGGSWRALDATARLFRRVAREAAAALDLEYPDKAETSVSAYLRQQAERA